MRNWYRWHLLATGARPVATATETSWQHIARTCKNNALTKAYEVDVQVRGPKTSKVGVETASLYLPHLLFADLATSYSEQFEKIFRCSELAAFWKNVEAVKDERLQGHICLDKRQGLAKRHVVNAERAVPLFIRADGVEFQTRDTIKCWNWGGLLSQFSSLQKSHPELCLSKVLHNGSDLDTHHEVHQVVTGEFARWLSPLCWARQWALAKKGLSLKTWLEHRSHLKASGGVVWSIQCDHEMYSLAHTGTASFPAENVTASNPWQKGCHALKENLSSCSEEKSRPLNAWAMQKPWQKAWNSTLCSKSQAWASKWWGMMASMSCLQRVSAHHLCGSILHFLCDLDGKGKQSIKPSDRLALIFFQVQDQYKKQKRPTRLTNLKLSMACDVKSPHKDYPKLGCKAAECKHFMPAHCCLWSKPCLIQEIRCTNISCMLCQAWLIWSSFLMMLGCSLTEGHMARPRS